MPNTYACKGVSNPNVPIFLPRVCTLVLFRCSITLYSIIRCSITLYSIIRCSITLYSIINPRRACAARVTVLGLSFCLSVCPPRYSGSTRN